MQNLLIATGNRHKTSEFARLLGGIFVVSDLSAHPELPPVEETGTTFLENATLKAVETSRAVEGLVLADDSGLEVDALDGLPGVRSARYSGPGATDASNRARLLAALADIPADRRGARFRCVLALATNGTLLGSVSGTVEGVITGEERGSGGFGYDPVFIPSGRDATFAELPAGEKNALSHRGNAIAAFLAAWPDAFRPPDETPKSGER